MPNSWYSNVEPGPWSARNTVARVRPGSTGTTSNSSGTRGRTRSTGARKAAPTICLCGPPGARSPPASGIEPSGAAGWLLDRARASLVRLMSPHRLPGLSGPDRIMASLLLSCPFAVPSREEPSMSRVRSGPSADDGCQPLPRSRRDRDLRAGASRTRRWVDSTGCKGYDWGWRRETVTADRSAWRYAWPRASRSDEVSTPTTS